ncbi:MAG: Na+/H+ antiporter [Gemmatimonadetes bacterium]|nr:Na+/H+ antiporter [Gemmatimonadota bacterium]
MSLPFGVEHADPAALVLIALAVILAGAKLGGHIAERAGQPAVLGELAAGVVLGNLYHLGLGWFHPLASNGNLDMLARLGAVILLFEVGLESTVREMLVVGTRSFVVAVLGVAAPWALGWWVGALLLPNHSVYVHAFLGATLTATSVGITARVLSDLGLTRSNEARIILGAAVIDDVLGLVILAVITSFVTAANAGTTMSVGGVVFECVKATAFLAGAIIIGSKLSPRLFAATAKLRGRGVLLATALVFCFVLSALASAIGLAAIVGAYAAGLLLEEQHYRDDAKPVEHSLQELIRPISSFLVPVFFVLMGMRVDLAALLRTDVLVLAAVLTAAAIIGKQACALGAWGPGVDRISVGFGMIPRGEVGLIFANIGLALSIHGERLIDDGIYSAVVITVMATTLLTPLALKWRLGTVRSAIPAFEPASAGD